MRTRGTCWLVWVAFFLQIAGCGVGDEEESAAQENIDAEDVGVVTPDAVGDDVDEADAAEDADDGDIGGSEEPEQPGAAEIAFPTEEFVIGVSDPQRPEAEVIDLEGAPMEGAHIGWTSADESILEITSGGFALGHEPGQTELTATHGELEAKWPARVTGATLASVEIVPVDATVVVGWELPYLINLYDDDGGEIDDDLVVDWSTTDEAIATIDDSGVAHAHAAGEVEVVATVEDVEDRTTLTVLDAEVEAIEIVPSNPQSIERGEELQLEVNAFDLDGEPLESPVVEWWSSDSEVVSVDEVGLVEGVGVGEATVTAQLGELEASVEIRVIFSVQHVATGDGFGCAVAAQRLNCWGKNSEGQLGDGTFEPGEEPTAADFDGDIDVLSLGADHGCLIDGDGEVWCWGKNDSGQLGRPAGDSEATPVALEAGLEFHSVSAGAAHSCGVTVDNEVYCWGANEDFQLGHTGPSTHEPTEVGSPSDGPVGFRRVAAGGSHSCAIGVDDTGYCWGANQRGQLGGEIDDDKSAQPRTVIGGYTFSTISAGRDFTCGTAASGPPVCWGANDRGQLGNGGKVDQDVPLTLDLQPGESLSTIVAGAEHACGLAAGGSTRCWGAAGDGRLGISTSDDVTSPQPTDGDESFSRISAGGAFNCGRTPGHEVLCWGAEPAEGATMEEVDL